MLELVSVHVPKTGGTTLGNALRRKYGMRLRLIYPPPKRPISVRLRLTATRAIRHWRPFPRAVHGHFPASRYAGTGAQMITFVRDPLMTRISLWHYVRRRNRDRGEIANLEWSDALSLELPDFLELPAPTLSRYIDVPLDRFAFIGVAERYEEGMQQLCEMINAPYRPERINTNPSGSGYKIPAEWRRIYEAANPQEVALYEAAQRTYRRL